MKRPFKRWAVVSLIVIFMLSLAPIPFIGRNGVPEVEMFSFSVFVDGDDTPSELTPGVKEISWNTSPEAQSCLLYRVDEDAPAVLLAVPGFPYFNSSRTEEASRSYSVAFAATHEPQVTSTSTMVAFPIIRAWVPVPEPFAVPDDSGFVSYEFPSDHSVLVSEVQPGHYGYVLWCIREVDKDHFKMGYDDVRFAIVSP